MSYSPATYANQFPSVANHIPNDPTPKNQAIYIPAVNPGFARAVHEQKWTRALPNGVASHDLNFLDQNQSLLRLSHALSSAGQALNQNTPCMISARDRAATTLVCDSGGYQIASGRLHINGDRDRLKILRWLEQQADYAMTLDVPTGSINSPDYPFKSSRECLDATLEHLHFFQKNRKAQNVKFLNVLQGNTQQETDEWYDAVKGFAFEGWAIAGILRLDFYNTCRRIITMADENQLQDKVWVHVLGTGSLESAVLLTALQRAINRYINPNLRISYDTSSAFRSLNWSSAYTFPTFSLQSMSHSQAKIPDDMRFVGSDIRWPWPSALGDKLVMGDVCVNKSAGAGNRRDQQSNHYIVHHNLGSLCWAIATANRVFDAQLMEKNAQFARKVDATAQAIDRVLKAGTITELQKYRQELQPKSSGMTSAQQNTGDYDRLLQP